MSAARRRGRLLPIGIVAVVAIVVALVAGDTGERPPLDPRSTRPDGTRALVLLLEELGATVEVVRGPVPAGASTAVAFADRFNDEDTEAVLAWVADGGVLVINHDDEDDDLRAAMEDAGPRCPNDALATVGRLRLPSGSTVGREALCSFVTAADVGAGSIVEVGTGSPGSILVGGAPQPQRTSPFVNELLDEEDNAVLAAALLAPAGTGTVAVLEGSIGGAGDRSLYDVLGPTRRQALAQLLVAAVVLVLWRGRRLGRPVVEPHAVDIAGSELVAAVGRLLDARRRPDEAADLLRAEVRAALELRLGVAADGPVDAAADAVAARTGLDAGAVAAALAHAPVTSDAELVALAERLDTIRAAVLGPAPHAVPATTRRNP